MHPGQCRVEVAGRNGLAFVADAVNGNDAPVFHKEPKHARVQLADVTQLQQTVTERLGERARGDTGDSAISPDLASLSRGRRGRFA